jgi:DNA-binding winged helix-turn-helix (wHTH) protein
MRYRFGVFRLDLGPPLKLSSGNSPVEMQQRPLEVLRYLLENRPRPVPKEELKEKIWGQAHVEDEPVWTAISKIRDVVGSEFVQTARKAGWRIAGPVVEEAGEPAPGAGRLRFWRKAALVAAAAIALTALAAYRILQVPLRLQITEPANGSKGGYGVAVKGTASSSNIKVRLLVRDSGKWWPQEDPQGGDEALQPTGPPEQNRWNWAGVVRLGMEGKDLSGEQKGIGKQFIIVAAREHPRFKEVRRRPNAEERCLPELPNDVETSAEVSIVRVR